MVDIRKITVDPQGRNPGRVKDIPGISHLGKVSTVAGWGGKLAL